MITAGQIKIPPKNNFCFFQIPEPKKSKHGRINKTTTSCDDDNGSCGSNGGGVHWTMTHNAGSKFDSFSRFRLSRRKGKRKKIGWTGNNLRQWPSSASWPPPSWWHNPTDDDRVSFKGDPTDPALWWSSTVVGRLRYVLVRKLFNILVQSCVVIFHTHQRTKFRFSFFVFFWRGREPISKEPLTPLT